MKGKLLLILLILAMIVLSDYYYGWGLMTFLSDYLVLVIIVGILAGVVGRRLL
jgi:hypothetical protein